MSQSENEILLNNTKEWITGTCKYMHLLNIMLSNTNWIQRSPYYMIDLKFKSQQA